MARGPCLLCFHEAGVALSHLMVSKKRLDMILAFSNSYGNIFALFFCQFLDGFITKKMLKSLQIQKNYFHFHTLHQFHSECLNQFGEKWRKWLEGPVSLLCFHEADVALSHLMVSKKRSYTILAISNSYGNKKLFFLSFQIVL